MAANHWRATSPRWALERDSILMTGEFPLSCGTVVRLPRLFATKKKAIAWAKQHTHWKYEWRPVRVELGYKRISKDNP
jgi:hypothetical protein